MSETLVLAIDLGTSAVKVAAVAADGRVVAGSRRLLSGSQPAGWWRNVLSTTHECLVGTEAARIAAISLCGR
ncbi:MAG TPA: hypothetical protein VH916_10755, partial [Dehalococcoidia bacterium]